MLVERTGFEPVARLSKACTDMTRRRFQPLSHLSGYIPGTTAGDELTSHSVIERKASAIKFNREGLCRNGASPLLIEDNSHAATTYIPLCDGLQEGTAIRIAMKPNQFVFEDY